MGRKVVKLLDLAKEFGVKPETIRSWLKEGMPKKSGGGHGKPLLFDRDACLAWAAQQNKQSVESVTGVESEKKRVQADTDLDPDRERALLTRAQRLLADDKRRVIRGKYLRRSDVIEEIQGCVACFSAAMQNIDELIDGPQEIKAQVRQKIEEQLHKLADGLEKIPAKVARQQHSRWLDKVDQAGKPVAAEKNR